MAETTTHNTHTHENAPHPAPCLNKAQLAEQTCIQPCTKQEPGVLLSQSSAPATTRSSLLAACATTPSLTQHASLQLDAAAAEAICLQCRRTAMLLCAGVAVGCACQSDSCTVCVDDNPQHPDSAACANTHHTAATPRLLLTAAPFKQQNQSHGYQARP